MAPVLLAEAVLVVVTEVQNPGLAGVLRPFLAQRLVVLERDFVHLRSELAHDEVGQVFEIARPAEEKPLKHCLGPAVRVGPFLPLGMRRVTGSPSRSATGIAWDLPRSLPHRCGRLRPFREQILSTEHSVIRTNQQHKQRCQF